MGTQIRDRGPGSIYEFRSTEVGTGKVRSKIMILYKTETRVVQVASDCKCDRCGKSMRGDLGNINGLFGSLSGAYDGTAVPDGAEWKFQVCEECTVSWLDTFKFKPWESESEQQD